MPGKGSTGKAVNHKHQFKTGYTMVYKGVRTEHKICDCGKWEKDFRKENGTARTRTGKSSHDKSLIIK